MFAATGMATKTSFPSAYTFTSSGMEDSKLLESLKSIVASSVPFWGRDEAVETKFDTLSLLIDDETSSVISSEEALWITLQLAADAGNAGAFIHTARRVDWNRKDADELAEVVRWALCAGAHLMARNLATEGTHRYPQHEYLAKLAYILAPPKYLGSQPASPSTGANVRWLREHAAEYRGNWVALKNGVLIVRGESVGELRQQIGDLKGYMITKVW